MKDRKVEFGWTDLFEIWKLAYRKGYEMGYTDRNNGDYSPESCSYPPDVLRKIFYQFEQEEKE